MSDEEVLQFMKVKGIDPSVIQTMLAYKSLRALERIEESLKKRHIITNRSMQVKVDLTKAHADKPLGLEANDITYLWLTIEKADSSFTYKLKQTNKQKSGIFAGTQGASFDQHNFTEAFVTNAAAIGEAIILVGWRD